ncbi:MULTISPECIES: hypothetical protein [Kribbella]|uniref:Uncharacterized protein n=1 Tax=Kribbella karoonensis TaxID=324851 RepID=A0ABN2DZ62_9ACTN
MSAHRTPRLVATLAAAVVLLIPSTQALADNSQPQPLDWPTVPQPDQSGQPLQPQPVDWPAPKQIEG